MPKVKAIIFDMDGTLVDNISFHRDAWLLFLKKYNISLDPEQFYAQNNGTIDELIRHFFGPDTTDERVKELGQEKERTYRELYKNHIKEIEGLTGLLKTLKAQGIKVVLATMGDKPNIDFVLDTLKIRSFFNSITAGNEISKGKPDPEIFKLTLHKIDMEAKDCIVIEDSTGGVISARKAGINVIGITTTQKAEKLKQEGCFHIISNFKELDLDWFS